MIGGRIGRYSIDALLGAGGMGKVYLARDLALDRIVALKTVASDYDDGLRQRLLREADSAARLQHPAIATFFESGDADGTAYIAMELVRGRTLRARLDTGPLPVDAAISTVATLLEALNHAHAAGVLHRDIKPENIMLADDSGMPKLMDFGLAKATVESGAITVTNLTADRIVGTVGYMSPEQLRDEPLDERSDLFALAAVLYEMVSGRPAFPGTSPAARIAAILSRDPEPLSGPVPSALNAVLRRALSKDREARYASASALLRELRGVSSGEASRELPQTLAVVDLRNLSGQSQDDWIGSGIADSLTADLVRVSGLEVVAREKVLRAGSQCAAVDGLASDALALGSLLGCRWVVSGSFQRLGGAIRLTTTLTEVATGRALAAEKLDGTLDGIFDLQDRLSQAVTATLNLRTPTPSPEATRGRDVQAFEYFSRGRRMWQRLEKGSLDQARDFYELAIAIEPNYAPALAGLAAYHAMRFTFTTDADDLRNASEYARRAIAADPNIAEPHIWLGYAFLREGRLSEAIAAERCAQRLDPANPYGWYFEACVHLFHGSPAEAVPLFQRVVQREPHPFASIGLSAAHCALGRLDEAAWCVRAAIDSEDSDVPGPTAGAGAFLSEYLRLQGRLDDARVVCIGALAAVERSDHMYRDTFRGIGLLSLARIALDKGEQAGAAAILRQLLAHVHGRYRTLGGGYLAVAATAALTRAAEGPEHLVAARRLFEQRDRYNFSTFFQCSSETALLELARAAAMVAANDAQELFDRAARAGAYEAVLLRSG
jgi:TolB-like protein/tetratricopeptide (TPR) repeat protein